MTGSAMNPESIAPHLRATMDSRLAPNARRGMTAKCTIACDT